MSNEDININTCASGRSPLPSISGYLTKFARAMQSTIEAISLEFLRTWFTKD
jgi:hypothetical protein